MRGQVLGVDTRSGDGMIAGDDGQRYTFAPADWAHRGEPSIGATVDFEADGRGARNIFPLPVAAGTTGPVVRYDAASPPADPRRERSKFVAALLAFFLGTLGIHRFYLGRTGSGIVMLLLTLTVVGTLISWPLSLIDTFRYLTMNHGDFDARYRVR